MKLAVTGVTGFLGGQVALGLAAAGHQVRGVLRDPGRWQKPPAGAEHAIGDLRDPETVRQALDGCDAVIHIAALVKTWVPDRSLFDAVNVDAFRVLADRCRDQGLPLIYTSSFFALGSTDGVIADESRPRPDEPFHTDYVRTKTIADREAAKRVEAGQPIVRLYPGVVFGPGAWTEGNHVLKTLALHATGKLPGLLGPADRKQCFSFVEDIVVGFVQAVETMPLGKRFILGGENRTVTELFAVFQQLTGVRPPRIHIPYGVASLVGRMKRWRADRFGVEPDLTDEVVGLYRREWAYSSALAERELAYRITPFEEALKRSIVWMRETGRLPNDPTPGDA